MRTNMKTDIDFFSLKKKPSKNDVIYGIGEKIPLPGFKIGRGPTKIDYFCAWRSFYILKDTRKYNIFNAIVS